MGFFVHFKPNQPDLAPLRSAPRFALIYDGARTYRPDGARTYRSYGRTNRTDGARK